MTGATFSAMQPEQPSARPLPGPRCEHELCFAREEVRHIRLLQFAGFFMLKSPCFGLRSQAETWHVLHVLTLGDEFREGVVFCRTHEKFGKCLAQLFGDDKLRWRDVGTNGA